MKELVIRLLQGEVDELERAIAKLEGLLKCRHKNPAEEPAALRRRRCEHRSAPWN